MCRYLILYLSRLSFVRLARVRNEMRPRFTRIAARDCIKKSKVPTIGQGERNRIKPLPVKRTYGTL